MRPTPAATVPTVLAVLTSLTALAAPAPATPATADAPAPRDPASQRAFDHLVAGTTPSPCPDDDGWVRTRSPAACLRVGLHRPRAAASALYVYLHADSNPVRLDHGVLSLLRSREPSAATAVLVRPAYADADGNRTTPVTRPRMGDGYRKDDALALAEAIERLRDRVRARRVVIIGHSGGAALTANIAALRPGLADHVVIASCPCDLDAWRAHRLETDPHGGWNAPHTSLSPHLTAASIPPATRVTLLVGERDTNTPLFLHERYAALTRQAGVPTRLFVVPGTGHGVWSGAGVRALVVGLLQGLPQADLDEIARGHRIHERR